MNRGSDHIMIETVNNGFETRTESAPMIAKTVDEAKYFGVNSPDIYIMKPKRNALTMRADERGSIPKTYLIAAKIAGQSGGCSTNGQPQYVTAPTPVAMFLAVAIYPTESGESPAPQRFVDNRIMPVPTIPNPTRNSLYWMETEIRV